jgi:23S rRNA (cytosine1962-C5)-methyltransferase
MNDQMEIIKSNLQTAWKRRQAYVESHLLSAYRLVTQEELEMPLAVDIYSDCAVLQIYDEYLDQAGIDEVKTVLSADFQISGFFEKRRYRVKESPEAGGDLKEKPVEKVINENGHKFLVNLNNYLDTGLFLDHRETRSMVERMVSEKVEGGNNDVQVLNLFAYTGSFSVYAAAGGAAMTHTVDLSKTYCEWARRNLELNGCLAERNWVYRMDVWEFYRYAARKGLSFDLIIIDPPTFSRNKESNFSVQRDQVKLIDGAASLLREGGKILFSNNCLDFELDSGLEKRFLIKNIQNETIPMDFWIDTIHRDWLQSPNQIHNCFILEK